MSTDEPTGAQVEKVFSAIYEKNDWNKLDPTVRSGEGSVPARNRPYMDLLNRFLRERQIQSVVDLGCGDWSFSQLIDWSGIQYTGVDVVPELIASHNARFARPGVQFLCRNFVEDEVPEADLVICKEALQHLPNALVSKFLSQLPRFRYALLTNDRIKYEPRTWRRLWRLIETPVAPNFDIAVGHWRPLRLREPPFNLPASELARIRMWHSNGIHVKEVLVWTNPAPV